MTSQAFAVGLILVLLIVVFMYLTRQKTPSGGTVYPQVKAEAYLYYDPSNPSPTQAQANNIAKSFGSGSRLATPGDLAYYASMGGYAGWYGTTSTGGVFAVSNPIYAPSAPVTAAPCQNAPYGVWVHGLKGSLNMKNVSPFNCAQWFQPAPKGS